MFFRRKKKEQETTESVPAGSTVVEMVGGVKQWLAGVRAEIPVMIEKLKDLGGTNYELGNRYSAEGHLNDAILRYRVAVWFAPDHLNARYNLGCCLLDKGLPEKAAEQFRRCLERAPDFIEARYMLALTGGGGKIDAMPLTLAEDYFNVLARSYGASYLELTGYQGHLLLCAAVSPFLVPGQVDLAVLDLGCGSGFAGRLLRPLASHLVGVDISARMLDVAKEMQQDEAVPPYDALIHQDIERFLAMLPPEQEDVILAANVLNYMGDLDAVFQGVARALKKGGLFAFTAEISQEKGFHLIPLLGRFAHAPDYLAGLASANGLELLSGEKCAIYPDMPGWCAVYRKREVS